MLFIRTRFIFFWGLISLIFFLSSCSSAGHKQLIIQANDVGLTKNTDQAAVALLEKHRVTSLSLIVVSPRFQQMAKYAESHKKFDFGVRLYVTSAEAPGGVGRFKPVLPPEQVRSLVDNEGYFLPLKQFLKNYQIGELQKELQAQIDLARASGIEISHLSVGGGVLYLRLDMIELLLRLSLTNHIPTAVPDLDHFDQYTCFRATQDLKPKLQSLILENHLVTLAHWEIQDFNIDPRLRAEYLQGVIQNLPKGLSLIEIWPALDGDEQLALWMKSNGNSELKSRLSDYMIYMGADMSKWIKDSGIELVGWSAYPKTR